MKIYVSADIEGITGVTHWDEATIGRPGYEEARLQMTREVKAACEGAKAAGASEIWVKDAHDTGRNLLPDTLPKDVKVIRGWSGHPALMVQELDSTFAAVLMIGYHSAAGASGNPLSHAISLEVAEMTLNGRPASEFLLHTYEAARVGVPVAFLSGDAGICQEASQLLPDAETVPVMTGIGRSTVSIHPEVAIERIRLGVEKSIRRPGTRKTLPLPEKFVLEIRYKNHMDAYRAGFYPGAAQISSTQVRFECNEYFEVLRMLLFTTAE